MNQFSKVACFILASAFFSQSGYAQSPPVSISLNDLAEFRFPGKNWVLASDATASLTAANVMKPVSGTGVVVNTKSGTNLITIQEYGDVEIDLDFMVAKGSATGIWLQGRYNIQLSDSWTKTSPTYADMGGIGQRSNNPSSGIEGMAPMMNVARAPGLWQHLKVRFAAPKFNASGVKTSNARFEEVYVNGVLVQQQAEVAAPSQPAMYSDEKAVGPLVLQGSGGTVAFRNIRLAPVVAIQAPVAVGPPRRGGVRIVNPILLDPSNEPYLLRGYLNYGTKKRTHVISVGSPNQTNYSYDLKQGALLQVWRGRFVDVTEMWEARGEPQLEKPNGSVVILSGAPALASLADANAVWPDSIAFDDLNNKGYVLDQARNPTFKYVFMGANVEDKISIAMNGQSIVREISVSNAPANFYCRVAAAGKIESVGKGLYAIDGKSHYIQVDARFKPTLRKTSSGQELITSIGNSAGPLTYSIIW